MVSVATESTLTIDVVIPSIRLDSVTLSSMIRAKIPPKVKLQYYVVSDNQKVSATGLNLDTYPVQIIVNSNNLGAALSRNVGLDMGTGEWILFIDDDVIPNENLIQHYIEAIEKDPDAAGYVGPTIFPEPINAFTIGIRASDILTFFDLSLHREWVPWGTTSNLLIRRDHIGDIRFSAQFPKHGGGEDIDFCLCILKKSKRWFKSVPKATVHHNWWNGGHRTYKRFFRWAFGDSLLPKLHPKNQFRNFPNMIETLILGTPVLLAFSVAGLLPLQSIGVWICLVVLSEFIVERFRVATRFGGSSVRDAFEATIVRLSNDLGRILGCLRRGDISSFLQRFDYFLTRESIPFERKIAMFKFILFSASILLALWF